MHRYDHGNYYPWKGEDSASSYLGKAKGLNINIPFCDYSDARAHDFSADLNGSSSSSSSMEGKYKVLKQYKENKLNRNEMKNEDYFYVLENIIRPIIIEFEPQFVIISNGLDAGRGDPLGKYGVSPEDGFSGMLHRILKYTSKQKAKILLLLEGGYNLTTLKIASNSMLEFLVAYYEKIRLEQENEDRNRNPSVKSVTSCYSASERENTNLVEHELLKLATVDISSVKNSLLLDMQKIILDILGVWQRKLGVKELLVRTLHDISEEIKRREVFVNEKILAENQKSNKNSKQNQRATNSVAPAPSGRALIKNNKKVKESNTTEADAILDLSAKFDAQQIKEMENA